MYSSSSCSSSSWSKYFAEEVTTIMRMYCVPDALCEIIASYMLGIYFTRHEAMLIKDHKMKYSIVPAETDKSLVTRIMTLKGSERWMFSVKNGFYHMGYTGCLNESCRLWTRLSVDQIPDATLWNLKLIKNMFDFLFESKTYTYDTVVLHETKIAILASFKRKDHKYRMMLNHLNDSLHQIIKGKNYHSWYGLDKYQYGYFGTSSAVVILQHIEDVDNDLIEQGYKFGIEHRESHLNTLWRNRIYSRHSAQLNYVVLNLIPYAQFSSLVAVNELMRSAKKRI